MKKQISFLFGFFCFIATISAQSGVDSLHYTPADTVRAWALLKEAKTLIGQGAYDSALVKAEEAERIFEAVMGRRCKGVADALHLEGLAYYFQGDLDKAMDFFEKSLQLRVVLFGDFHIKVADSYNNLGICFAWKGDYDPAINCYNKALEIRIKILEYDHPDISGTYNNLGVCFNNKGDFYLAIQYYKKSLEINKKIGYENLNIAGLYNNIGSSLADIGDYDLAIEYHKKALEIRLKKLGGEHPDVAQSYSQLGKCYASKDNFDIAIEYHKKALEVNLKKLGDKHPDVAIAYNDLGNDFGSKGDHIRAIECHQIALGILLEELGEDHWLTAISYISIGNCYFEAGDYDRAIQCYQMTLSILQKQLGKEHYYISLSYINLGLCFFDKNDFIRAFQLFNAALKSAQLYTDDLKYADLIFNAFNNLAILHFTLFQKSSSHLDLYLTLTNAQKALESSNHQRRPLSREGSKTLLAQKAQPAYELAIKASYLLHQTTDSTHYHNLAFNYAEQSKATVLYEAMQAAKAKTFADIDPKLLEQEHELQIDLAFYDRKTREEEEKPLDERSDSLVAAYGAKVFDLRQRLDTLVAVFDEKYPEYKRLKYDFPSISLAEAQQFLLSDQALLEYFVGDSSIFIFLVKKDDYRVIEVKKNFPLETWVKQLRHGIYGYHTDPNRNDNLRDSCIAEYIESATALYQKLLAPVDSLLPRRVVIVPDGVLGYIPFEALLSAKPEREDRFHTYPYFGREKGREHSIGYCYSATLLREMTEKQHRRKPAKMLGAFAPYYDGDTTVLAGLDDLFATRSVAPGDLEPLKYSGAEVAAAQKLLGGDVFSDSVATEARFNAVAGDYRILHLSTHGKADDRAGDYSYLVFSPQKDSLENELLYCRDIYNLSLNADLVVLSACETGIGELKRGEGIISLARAFAYAGAKSIVTTLWSVDDAKTKDFMVFFYRNLKQGMTKDEALAKARSDYFSKYKNEKAHPFFWAGFVGIGDMAPVK